MDNPTTKLAVIKAIIQEWLDKQGHERCWYYPDLFQQLAQELNIKPSTPPNLPPEAEFEKGCQHYRAAEYNKP